MREIKFRAWDKNNNKMQYGDEQFEFEGDGCVMAYFIGMSITGDQNPPIMQYTGLKDKHNIEIYEGDICRCLDSYGENYYISDIDYNGGAFSVEVSGCNYDYTALGWALENDDINEIEVIGNIHENPELLEAE